MISLVINQQELIHLVKLITMITVFINNNTFLYSTKCTYYLKNIYNDERTLSFGRGSVFAICNVMEYYEASTPHPSPNNYRHLSIYTTSDKGIYCHKLFYPIWYLKQAYSTNWTYLHWVTLPKISIFILSGTLSGSRYWTWKLDRLKLVYPERVWSGLYPYLYTSLGINSDVKAMIAA